jgi:serine/threonine protein kinase/WD40 repeat protein
MANNNPCTECGEALVNGLCANPECSLVTDRDLTSQVYGSLSPASMASLDPGEIVDYTGTIGTAPSEFGSGLVEDMPSINEEDFAQTRMVDDDFYQQVQTFFPAESGSASAGSHSAPKPASINIEADRSQSISLRESRSNLAIDDFIPPVREIKFPSDTASLDQIRQLDPDTIEGDEYHIQEKLGEGGYGVVFEAEQMALNRPVAIKVLKPKRKKGSQSKSPSQSGTGTGELQRRRDQFLHEAKITAKLQHPNIVPLYDFGINSTGQLFYSMKKVERRPWSSVLHKPDRLLNIPSSEVDALAERQAISRNIEIFSRVCDAMAYAHAMNVVHRDLKPDNIMIGNYGEVLLIDFGMALDLSSTNRQFSAGGTLVYMAPEMALHFSKQKEIQIAAHKTAQVLGVDKGTIFLDQSNIIGIGSLAQKLIKESQDRGVIELAESLIRLDAEEKDLANQIGCSSDIYLLGAILYQIAVGHPPHYFPLSACKKGQREKFQKELWLALRNGFQQYNKLVDPLRISLRDIAIRAMRTNPEDRFQSVEELQVAIRGFQKQVQSLELTESGKEELEKAKGREDYQHLLPALESFRGASELWPEGVEAPQLRRSTACEYAKRAGTRRDYDAGLSILDEYVLEGQQKDKSVVETRQRLIQGKKRTQRNRILGVVSAIAAVLLPLAFFLYFTYKTADVMARRDEALKREKTAIAAEVSANAQKALAIKTRDEVQSSLNESQGLLNDAQEKLAEVAPKLQRADEVEEKLEKLEPLLEAAQAAKQEADKGLEDANKKLVDAKAGLLEAEQAKKEAVLAADESKKLAAKFQFDADFRQYNSNVLTIPLDFRTSKLKEASAKLDLLESSDAKPQFKNGWLVKHFSKQLNSGKSVTLDENASITDILSIPGSSESLAIGSVNGKTSVWKLNAEGSSNALPLSINESGELKDATISSDGNLLGLAFDSPNGEENGAGIVVVNRESGNTIRLSEESQERIAGCKHVQFSDTDASRLIAVEEMKGHFDLKQRIHVVEYRIAGGELEEVSRKKVDATNRSEERITNYLASVHWNNGRATTAVAFDSLTPLGEKGGAEEVWKIQLVSETGETSKSATIERFPTALLMGLNAKLYCGHRDGKVDVFDARNLEQKPQPVDVNINENEIAVLAESEDGRLMAGSRNGQIVIWQADRQLKRKVDGQKGQLTSIAIFDDGRFFSSDDAGSVSLWQPGEEFNPASIDKRTKVQVTCGAVDHSLDADVVPATAYGTASGNVFYFDSAAMKANDGGKQIEEANSSAEFSAKFRFKSPFESFDNAFDDFDSMGIVDDWFIVMKNDGNLVATQIEDTVSRKNYASSRMNAFSSRPVKRGFIPAMGSVHDRDYFYTNDPSDEENLLLWRRSGNRFAHTLVTMTSGRSTGQIKRLVMSPDGNWLAVVRLARRRSGEYRTEVFEVGGGKQSLAASKTSELYRVGDPAFVGFSNNSAQLMFHQHSSGSDRTTSVRVWNLAGSQWDDGGRKPQLIAEQKVDLVDWANSPDLDELVTRFNRNYSLKPIRPSSDQSELPTSDENRLRNVLVAGGTNQYYVLTSNSLALYDKENRVNEESTGEFDPENARDMRVFGDRVIVLDQNGFHLLDKDLTYVTKLAARKAEVQGLSLSGQKLAICYSNKYCRIWNVGGDKPTAIGSVKNASRVELSPDGKWAACLVDDEIRIFDVGSRFNEPKKTLPAGVFRWSGKPVSKLIVAGKGADRTDWFEFDPTTGERTDRKDLPAKAVNIKDFKLAPLTENFVAIQFEEGMSLWATGEGEDLMQMNLDDHEFDATPLKDIKSITFSEMAQDDPSRIGTRMAVLASDGSQTTPIPRIYLLAKQLQENFATGEQGEENSIEEYRYRVVEIEGALQSNVTSALDLKSLDFSGDGKSLIKVDELGTTTLLSE